MKRLDSSSVHFAVCIDNSGYPASLELHKIYRVLPDEDAAEEGEIFGALMKDDNDYDNDYDNDNELMREISGSLM